jgi:hypothetical protein
VRSGTAFLTALALSIVGSIVFVLGSIPHGEGSFGIVKMVPFLIAQWGAVFFAFTWFVANIIAFVAARKRDSADVFVLLLSGAFMAAAIVGIHKSRKIDADYAAMNKLKNEAEQTSTNFSKFSGIVAEYCRLSPQSIYPQNSKFQVISALLANPKTSPEILQELSDGLSERHEFLGQIAAHPNCPPAALERFRKIPWLDVYLVRNPNASADLLESLSKSTNAQTRADIVRHSNTTESTLKALQNDEDWMVKDAFRRRREIDEKRKK